MTRPRWWILTVVTVAIFGVACDGGSTSSSVVSPPSSLVTTPAVTTVVSDDERARAALDRAVDSLLEAGSYSFEVEVILVMGATTVQSELEGWVDGFDRELQLKVGDNAVISRVLDGVATVERDGILTEVPLERAEEPPSLEILRTLDQAILVSSTEIAGFIDASVLESAGFNSERIATAVLYLTESGALAGYEIQSSDSTWMVSARFSNVGSSFSN